MPLANRLREIHDALEGPGNRNVLTLVTLGVESAAIKEFLDWREIGADPFHPDHGQHVGVWELRDAWASKIKKKVEPTKDFEFNPRELLRRARMLESEFMFRWIRLDSI